LLDPTIVNPAFERVAFVQAPHDHEPVSDFAGAAKR
jgi:hypothetical protein